jgi:hypothetical protein
MWVLMRTASRLATSLTKEQLPIDSSEVNRDNYEKLVQSPERLAERISSAGITVVQDAVAGSAGRAITGGSGYEVYDELIQKNELTFRLNMAQYFQDVRLPPGTVHYFLWNSRALAHHIQRNPSYRGRGTVGNCPHREVVCFGTLRHRTRLDHHGEIAWAEDRRLAP